MEIFKKPFAVEGHEFFLTGSAGISVYPVDGEDAEVLIKNADIAMYKAKASGKNQYIMCTKHMKEDVKKKMILSNHLFRAIDNQELIVYYQPQISFKTGKIIGIEALLRWQHPEHGMLGGSAKGHVAVLPPVLLMKADVRQKIDGRFEHIEQIGYADPVEAVPRITALNVAAIALAGGIDAPLVPVTGNAVFIISDEHGVVVDLRFICGWLGALKDESGAGELCQHIPVDAAALHEVGVDPPHIRVRWRECERFPLLCGFFPRR